MLLALPLCANGVHYGAVNKLGVENAMFPGPQAKFFPWKVPAGIPPIKHGLLTFDGGLFGCAGKVVIDLDRRVGYAITSCNEGRYDAIWARVKAAADRTLSEEVNGERFNVAIRHFSIPVDRVRTLVCEANAAWQAPVQRPRLGSPDYISSLILRDGGAMRIDGGTKQYSGFALTLRADIKKLAGDN